MRDVSDREILLYVQKRYLRVLKMIRYFMHSRYNIDLYSAFFKVEEETNGLYHLRLCNTFNPRLRRTYAPKIEITDKEEFADAIDKIFNTDLMQLKQGRFINEGDTIVLDFDTGYISREPILKKDAIVWWDGVKDKFSYNLKKESIEGNIGDFLSLEVQSSSVSKDWLELLEKHDSKFDNVSFDIDPKLNQKKDQFKVDIAPDYKDIKLVKTKR